MARKNLLIVMTDEHTRKVMGCYGNPHVKTPNMDRLAARGTLFERAYSTSPICIPARAIIATGRYVNETRNWDNAFAYTGAHRSWMHALSDAGWRVESIGKLHFRNEEDDTGFQKQHLPMHVVGATGDVLGCVRDPMPPRPASRKMAEKIGPGTSSYSDYDVDICELTVSWLKDRAAEGDAAPWALFASFVTPHFPLIAPELFYDMYKDKGLMPQKPWPPEAEDHPWLAAFRKSFLFDNFTPETTAIALACYYGLVSFVDDRIGKVLDTLEALGMADDTLVIYTSDHGDNIGERGLWGKSNFFEEAAGIPMIVAGPGMPTGKRSKTPVSLYDIYPTALDWAGVSDAEEGARPGRSLLPLATAADDPDRPVVGEYHAAGAATGTFMVRKGRFKYIHYVDYPPQLFDLDADFEETADLAGDPTHKGVLAELEAELRRAIDPEDADRRAKADQAALVEVHGGRAAVIARGGFGATPPPGSKPEYAGG